MIYLKHPLHGNKVATMEAEALYDESNGWLRYNPNTPVVIEVAPVVNELKRRGRPRQSE